jgi:hypothetical protein
MQGVTDWTDVTGQAKYGRSDGFAVVDSITFVDGVTDHIVPLAALNVAGTVQCEVTLFKGEIRATTNQIRFIVRADINTDPSLIADTNFPILDQLIKDTKNLNNEAAADADRAEAAATTATTEADRSKSEADRAAEIVDSKADKTSLDTTNLTLSKTNSELSTLSNIVSTLNPNNETKQTVSGYDRILSLPKNAANAPVGLKVDGMTLKNELNYNNETWAEWTKVDAIGDSTGLEFTLSDITNARASIPTNVRVNTKYGLLFSVISNGLTVRYIQTGNQLTGVYTNIVSPAQVGNIKHVFTTQSTITNNSLTLTANSYGDGGLKVKLAPNIRIYELPTGSEIESDFNTMTADQLAIKYPYVQGGSLQSAQSRFRLRSVGKNLFDGELELGGINSTTGLNESSTTLIRSKNYTKVNVSASYKVSLDGVAKTTNIFYYDSNRNFISYETASGFTTPNNCAYVRIRHISTNTEEKIQIEPGSTATTYEPHRTSTQYFNGTIPLYRVPNGTVNSIEKKTDGSSEEVERNKLHELVAGDIANLTTTLTNVDIVAINKQAGDVVYNDSGTEVEKAQAILFPNFTAVINSGIDNTSNIGKIYNASTTRYGLVVSKNTYVNLAAAQNDLVNVKHTKIIYQLATPTRTPLRTSGTLLSYPSGTIYLEPYATGADIYASGISIVTTDFPIKALESVVKVDFNTGLETEIDISTAVIAGDGLSFTHSDLTDGDIIFFTYEFESYVPQGYKTFEYIDSRFVVYNSDDGKYYTWSIAVTGTSPVTASIVPTEVT